MSKSRAEELNKEFHSNILKRLNWLFKMKPKSLAAMMARLLAPDERRRIVDTGIGIRLYIDPLTHLGRKLILDSRYEEKTVQTFRSEIQAGQVVLDIGANEGFFSTLAGTIVGPKGLVIAIEPQSRLRDLIEINLRINAVENFMIFSNAFGGNDGTDCDLSLYPILYTGQSSIVKKYKYSLFKNKETEKVEFISTEQIMNKCQVEAIDFVKVDVEGFEHKVVQFLLPFIEKGKIKKLLLDYHTEILLSQNVNPIDIHSSLISRGMDIKYSLHNDTDATNNVYGGVSKLESGLRAYILYQQRQA